MKVLQPVPVRVLASRIIPSVDPGLAVAFSLSRATVRSPCLPPTAMM
ncbi:MAG: hypothetical protein ACLRWP_15010 [Bilophila wadsworthia]